MAWNEKSESGVQIPVVFLIFAHAQIPLGDPELKRDTIPRGGHICPYQQALGQHGRVMAHSCPSNWGRPTSNKGPSQAEKKRPKKANELFHFDVDMYMKQINQKNRLSDHL